MSKTERIEAEKVRLAALFWNLPRDQFYALLGIIEQCAFLRITLDDLANEISENGATDTYNNGRNQSGEKISAQLQAYNRACTLYEKLTKQLLANLPNNRVFNYPGASENDVTAFLNFRNASKIDYYLSDDYAKKIEEAKAKAIELMLQGN